MKTVFLTYQPGDDPQLIQELDELTKSARQYQASKPDGTLETRERDLYDNPAYILRLIPGGFITKQPTRDGQGNVTGPAEKTGAYAVLFVFDESMITMLERYEFQNATKDESGFTPIVLAGSPEHLV